MRSFTDSCLVGVSAEQTEPCNIAHPCGGPAFRAYLLEDLVLLLNSSTQLGNFVVCGAIVSSVTKPIAVWTFLDLKACKLIAQHNRSVLNLLGLTAVLNLSEFCHHGPGLHSKVLKRY